MSTSINELRGLRHQTRRMVLPVAAVCALTFMVGCGGTSGGSDTGTVNSTAPTIDNVLPAAGPPAGGTLLTLTGTGFLEGVVGDTQVTIDGVIAADVIVIDDSTLTMISPANVNDTLADIRVTNSLGSAVLGGGFHYLATATILSDLNSDGRPDIVIAAGKDDTNGESAGAVYIFYGAPEGEVLADTAAFGADVTVLGAAEADRLGSAVATGDVNSDGHTDLIVGAPRADSSAADAGEVLVFLGPLPDSGVLNAADADIRLVGEGTVAGAWYGVMGDQFGTSISLGDSNGDQVLDLLVGAPGVDLNVGESNEIKDAGRAYLFLGGGALASQSADQAVMILSGAKKDDQLGGDLCLVDLNADGLADAAVSYDNVKSGANHMGRVAVFTTVVTEASVADAEVTLTSTENGDLFGSSITCGDVDGDGAEDLVVGAPNSNAFGSVTGRVYLFLGDGAIDTRFADDADVIYTGQQSNAKFGSELSTADVNGDGYADTLVGAPFTSFGATWDGQVFVFFGADLPVDTVAYNSDVILTGEPINGERFGSAIEVLDSDTDGIADIMTAATGHGGLMGRVYLFQGAETLADDGAVDDDLTLTGEIEGGSFGSSISRGK